MTRLKRWKSAAVGAAVAMLAATGLTVISAAPASAAARDGVCQKGEFCYYYNSNNEGSVSDFAGSIANYGTTQPTCYEFKGPGNGQGRCIKNDAASVWNRTGAKVRVYYNSNYGGAYQDFGAGVQRNLNATLKNNNASHKFRPGASGRFWLPFPCGETWQAGTRTNHNPQNSVDFNHYPEDLGWKVYSSAPGTVSKVANLGNTSYGRYIVIDHAGGWQTLYAHLRSQDVSVGQQVTEKTMIGRVGNTGGSTGPHLHYEQKLNGAAQKVTFKDGNPVYWGYKNLKRTTNCP
ncbi:peptidoglycan DD-metalloendopeptidase family protein [Saccharomonospora piscinae]|uniref:Peptidase M23 n=1 Tax=Saccharomonospora piscinae TaxID=687388 RepID=A0A1V9ABN5_SACPI|nr:peptidoglycan DD-metalloendopeptidase family protein [Saccharomonospora piscinae]OQO94545.1 peptidase M23 [Saccharomonospora piscinae]TLW94751.1 peptidase M23 [Saccharomonospora piscinae]